jgi:hypothetical protein
MAIGSILTKITVIDRITLLYIYQIRFLDFESIAMKMIVPRMASVATRPMVDVSAPTINAADLIVMTPIPIIIAVRKTAPVTPSGLSQNVFGLYPSILSVVSTRDVIQYSLRQAVSVRARPGKLLQNHWLSVSVFHWLN